MSQNTIWIGYIVLLVGFFYFFMYRPQVTRQKEQRALLSSLAVDDQVLTASGMYGTIRAIDEDVIEIEIADGVVVRMAKAAVTRKLEA
ncbi:MAG TPA: preprotein translocase subunit YajC [Coriobacteriia bacterium]|jgi:preprotein translocase subunit YajC